MLIIFICEIYKKNILRDMLYIYSHKIAQSKLKTIVKDLINQIYRFYEYTIFIFVILVGNYVL